VRVPYARQALSIDENRQIFVPEIWDESEESPEAKARGRIKQVWFPGVHSDTGGGYSETGLSDLALEWMIKEDYDEAEIEAVTRRHPARRADRMGPRLDRRYRRRRAKRQGAGHPT
jgi:uncharacterized protein (DUF2235 family)